MMRSGYPTVSCCHSRFERFCFIFFSSFFFPPLTLLRECLRLSVFSIAVAVAVAAVAAISVAGKKL